MAETVGRLSENQFDVLFVAVIVAVVVLIMIVVASAVVFIPKFHIIWRWYKDAKKEADFESLTKAIQKKLKKEKHRIAFAADVRDNLNDIKPYKDFNEMFGMEGKEILVIESADATQFDRKFKNHKIVVFKVCVSDIPQKLEEGKDKPLYWKLAEYCCNNRMDCVLLTEKYTPLDGLDNYYITTVNFYSKLRETLYNLLYFAP